MTDIERFINLLGQMRDTDLAKKFGVKTTFVSDMRNRLGIQKFTYDIALKRHENLLGVMPDRAVADIVGCSTGAVWRYRKAHGIHVTLREDVLMALLRHGYNTAEIASLLKVDTDTVEYYVDRLCNQPKD